MNDNHIIISVVKPREVFYPYEVPWRGEVAEEKSAENHKRDDHRSGQCICSFNIWRDRGDLFRLEIFYEIKKNEQIETQKIEIRSRNPYPDVTKAVKRVIRYMLKNANAEG